MANGWGVYYVVVLSAGLSVLILSVLYGLTRLLGGKEREPEKIESQVSMNPRFFPTLNLAVLFFALTFLLLPFAAQFVDLKQKADQGLLIRWFALMISVFLALAVGLFYSARKGDLSWLTGFYKKK